MSANINISNYESYLLSFVDGELNTEEIAELELFMQKNPGIREELALLNAVKIAPDKALVFENKANLYRGASALNLDNYEEYLLSYVDNELTATEVLAVEHFLEQHPQKRQELAWLQATRQQPDLSLQFENKAVLYRHAAKTRKIQPGIWWGAAAAVVAGLVLWLVPFNNKETAQGPVIANTTPTTPSVLQTLPAPGLVVTPEESKALEVTEIPVIAHTTPAPVKKEAAPNKVTVKKAAPKPVATPVVIAPDVAANNTPAAVPEKQEPAPVLATLAPPRNTSREVVENRLEENKANNITVTNTVKDPVLATTTHIDRTEKLEQPAAPPAQVRGELIASVSGSDSKLLDKVTNVAKLFSKRKR